MLRFLTSGESHGKCLVAILEGMPSGLRVKKERIDFELKRRQFGLGRSERQRIEKDEVQILSGIRRDITLGSPITLLIENKDFRINELGEISAPRPGHADLAGAVKYNFSDIRNVLERASARETAARVGVGAICKIFLEEFGIEIYSKVLEIGGQKERESMKRKIEEAKELKDSLGGIFEVTAKNAPIGLGSYVHYDRRLNARLALAITSIPGIKAIEFGLGFGYKDKFGSKCHDAIYYSKEKGFYRKTNNVGGIEGGISNGQDIVIRCCMKPISTLAEPLDSVDIIIKKKTKATIERADICAVESAGVIAEAMTAFILTDCFLEKFGSDNLEDIKRSFKGYIKRSY